MPRPIARSTANAAFDKLLCCTASMQGPCAGSQPPQILRMTSAGRCEHSSGTGVASCQHGSTAGSCPTGHAEHAQCAQATCVCRQAHPEIANASVPHALAPPHGHMVAQQAAAQQNGPNCCNKEYVAVRLGALQRSTLVSWKTLPAGCVDCCTSKAWNWPPHSSWLQGCSGNVTGYADPHPGSAKNAVLPCRELQKQCTRRGLWTQQTTFCQATLRTHSRG